MSLFWGTVGRRWLWPNTGLCTEFGEYFPEEEVKLSCECLRIDSSASSGWCIVCWLLLWATVGFLDDATWARFVFKPPSCPIRISTMLSNLKFLACSKIWTEPSPPQSPPPHPGAKYILFTKRQFKPKIAQLCTLWYEVNMGRLKIATIWIRTGLWRRRCSCFTRSVAGRSDSTALGSPAIPKGTTWLLGTTYLESAKNDE